MLRRFLFYLLTVLFVLGILRGLVLVARGALPWLVVPLFLVPAYAALRCYRIAQWSGAGRDPRR
jgi:hypothetical protein